MNRVYTVALMDYCFRLYQMNDDVYVSPNVWKMFTVSYMHYNTIGTGIGIVVGLIVSWLFPIDQNIDPKLLAPCMRKKITKQSTKMVEIYLTKSDDNSPVPQDQ
jgi:hypothetical protein